MKLRRELQEFVDQQVCDGRFASAEDMIEAGLFRLMLDAEPQELDEATLDAIDRAEEQYARGQFRDWEQVKAQLRAQFTRPRSD